VRGVLALFWLADPVDLFFLQIQGSGRIALPDGDIAYVGYSAQNGHAYRAIGRDLIEMGAVARADMSMQAILGWLLIERLRDGLDKRGNAGQEPGPRVEQSRQVLRMGRQPSTQVRDNHVGRLG